MNSTVSAAMKAIVLGLVRSGAINEEQFENVLNELYQAAVFEGSEESDSGVALLAFTTQLRDAVK